MTQAITFLEEIDPVDIPLNARRTRGGFAEMIIEAMADVPAGKVKPIECHTNNRASNIVARLRKRGFDVSRAGSIVYVTQCVHRWQVDNAGRSGKCANCGRERGFDEQTGPKPPPAMEGSRARKP